MDEFCSKAILYIKPALGGDLASTVSLNHEESPVIHDLQNGLLVLYVVDEGESLQFVQNRHLRAAGIDAEALHAVAMRNLLALIEERTRMQPHGNLFAVFLDGTFEASLLLVDYLWEEAFVEYAPNGFVAAVPARDMLAFADAASPGGIAELRDVISRVFPGGDHTISADLYRREAGRWVRFHA